MIRVRLMGHIGTSVGTKEVELPGSTMEAGDIVERVKEISGKKDPGFTRFNTLVMLEDGEAFVPAGRSVIVKDGARVVLIPFSHGG